MIADMHLHYPMHVMRRQPRETLDQMRRLRRRTLRDRARALIINVASRLGSDRFAWSGPRVDLAKMQNGGVGLAFSVLYSPFEEIDLDVPYGSAPASNYFGAITEQMDRVQEQVEGLGANITIVGDSEALDAAIRDGVIALVHCVEGGLFLGCTSGEVQARVATLADRGVAYITLAHLFWRGVATNAPALPFMWDWLYDIAFRQPKDDGLSELGRAAVEAMSRERVMVDISHMRADAIEETFEMLDDLPPIPVVASHAGFRFGRQKYMLDSDTIEQIGRRNGVVGLIMAHHQLNNGLHWFNTSDLDESFEVIRKHIDKIREITGSNQHVALGTDFDGFIKPTVGGLQTMSDFAPLEDKLRREYGSDEELITSGNATRVLHDLWSPEPAAA